MADLCIAIQCGHARAWLAQILLPARTTGTSRRVLPARASSLYSLKSANLVDITYLFENGALIDFTPDELISLLKALFADSEKREKAIERIEQGL